MKYLLPPKKTHIYTIEIKSYYSQGQFKGKKGKAHVVKQESNGLSLQFLLLHNGVEGNFIRRSTFSSGHFPTSQTAKKIYKKVIVIKKKKAEIPEFTLSSRC